MICGEYNCLTCHYVTVPTSYPSARNLPSQTLMMMMMMVMNFFCGMVDRRKTYSRISSQDHCQMSSPSRISASRIWATAEHEFSLRWMKLCSSYNHYTTVPRISGNRFKVELDSISAFTKLNSKHEIAFIYSLDEITEN